VSLTRTLVALGVVLFTCMLWPAPTAAQDPVVRKAQCRLTIGTSIRHYASALLIRIGKCHQLRLQAKLPANLDCNDPSTWAAQGYAKGGNAFARDVERLRGQMEECRPSPQTPPEVGYATCPAPCAGLPVTTFPEVGECLRCVADAYVLGVADSVLGMPPLPVDAAPRKCLASVGRRMVVYLNKSMLLEQNCEFRKATGQADFIGADCVALSDAAHPYANGIARARAKVADQVGKRCAGVDIVANLDSCGTDAATEGACAIDAVDQCTAVLFGAVFPPLP
jgi:hypothetical protein